MSERTEVEDRTAPLVPTATTPDDRSGGLATARDDEVARLERALAREGYGW